MNNLILALLIFTSSIYMSGCASIVEGSSQTMSVKTISNGNEVTDAFCEMENSKGTYFIKTPGTTKVQKANAPMTIKCKKDGIQPGIAIVESFTNAAAFGNLIFGAFVGTGIDMATGAAYVYPDLVTVLMGKSITMSSVENASKYSNTNSNNSQFSDVNAVPYLNENGREAYKTFLSKKPPKAFAIDEKGNYGWQSGGNESVAEKALRRCNARSNTECSLYAVNENVVWNEPIKTQSVAKKNVTELPDNKNINAYEKLDGYKLQCKELGFKIGTESFGNCVLKLSK